MLTRLLLILLVLALPASAAEGDDSQTDPNSTDADATESSEPSAESGDESPSSENVTEEDSDESSGSPEAGTWPPLEDPLPEEIVISKPVCSGTSRTPQGDVFVPYLFVETAPRLWVEPGWFYVTVATGPGGCGTIVVIPLP